MGGGNLAPKFFSGLVPASVCTSPSPFSRRTILVNSSRMGKSHVARSVLM